MRLTKERFTAKGDDYTGQAADHQSADLMCINITVSPQQL
jgi:hypothetical protein